MTRSLRIAALAALVARCASDVAGPPAIASVQVIPSTIQLQVAEATALSATARDADGNAITGSSISWRSGNTGIATVSDAGMVTGVAPGSTAITATAGGVEGTASVAVVAGPATQLSFLVLPSAAPAGVPITPPVQVAARDARGHVATSFTGVVTIALAANPGGATLTGTTAVTAVAGIATFANLRLDQVGSGYSFSASAPGLPPLTSTTFSVSAGTATQLEFTVQPTNVVAGAAIAPAVQVTARDALGNVATGFAGAVTLDLATNPGGGTLSGTTSAIASGGVATFANVRVDRTGSGYSLRATASGVNAVTSALFAVIPGPATRLGFTIQPTNTQTGATITPAVQVAALDAQGNIATSFTGVVTVAIANNPAGGALSGNTSASAASGVATFSSLSVDRSGVGYTLGATATGLTAATSAAFDIVAGAATQLVFTVQPSTTTAGAAIAPTVQVTARDATGNVATGFTGSVTLSIANNPGGGALSGTTTVTAVGGVAQFPGISINRSGTGYTLRAAAGGIPAVTSAAFTITAAAASQLVFTVQPSNATAGAAIAPPVEVTARDPFGNTATGFTGIVTMALGANPSGGTLTGSTSVAAVAGVATFGNLRVDRTGTGYTLQASSSALPSVTSTTFDVGAATPTRLAFTGQPTTTSAGASLGAVQVSVLDAQGNLAAGFTGNVTVAIGANPGGGTLSGTTTVAATAGVATFTNLSINRTGNGYTLTASSPGLTGAESAPFNIVPGAAAQLVFTVQPSTVVAGTAITPAVVVTARDASGNTATGFAGSVALAIGANPGGGTLSGTTAVGAVAGVATFPNLSIDRTGTGYTLTASTPGLPNATSAPFNVTPATATQLAFTVQPSTTPAGAAITPAVQVTARDAFGNTATGFTGSVTMALGANPSGGTLSGTTTVTASGGVATFANLSIDRTGVGYTLRATAAPLTAATSAAFDITTGTATQLAFTVHPGNTTAGTAITPAVQVSARDAAGNPVTTFTGTVTVAIGANPGGGTLSGTTSVAAVNGVATFPGLSIDKAGVGYTLTASATGLTSGTSAPFNIAAGAATALGFTVQPGNTAAGATITPAVQVTAQDGFGNAVSGFSGSVTVAIGTNPSGGSLSGTTTVGAVAGVATFSNLSINNAGNGYTLTASSTGLAGATSTAFNITAGSATQLAFTVQPTTTAAGVVIAPAVRVAARDNQGNTVTSFTGNVTVAIGTNPVGGTLSGTLTVAAVAGVATFSNLSIDKAASGYTLAASASGLTGASSAPFTISPAAATRLLFTIQPSSAAAGTAIAPPVQVTALDAFGNAATGFTGAVTVALGANPGGGALSGTTTASAVGGVATFSTLSLDKVGTGYTLTASASSLTGATSAGFNITPGAASRLFFTVQPSTAVVDVAISPAVEVTARDAFGNTATGFTGNVTVAIGANPGGATLSGTTTVGAVAGVATFANLSLNRTANGYTLTASSSGLTGATSDAFNVIPGTATQLAFTVQPSNTAAAATITPAVQVTARDALGNTATGFTGNITVAIASGTGTAGAVLSGTLTRSAVSGVATFNNLSIDRAGQGYRLRATSPGLSSATSATFHITTNVSATASTLTASTDTIGQCLTSCALGLDATRITVTVRNVSGTPLSGVAVTLSAVSPDSVVFSNPGPTGVTNGSGVFQADFRSGQALTKTISAVAGGAAITQTATIRVMPVIVGAGDIARCDLLSDDATANLLDGIPGVVVTLGDNAYPDGTTTDFADCYGPSWGRHKARTRPNPGNRDYNTPGAAPYYAYFGAVANPSGGSGNDAGYYSFSLGGWHIVTLNTEVSTSANSSQMTWLRQELNGRRNQCVLAIWHKPYFGSTSAPSGSAEPLWRTVADSGAEVVLNGHGHIYERFAPMDANGNASPTGVREFIVGTGGTGLGGFGTDPPNSVVRDKTTHGVIRIVLYPNRYRWEFIPAPGFGSFTDSGSANCN